MTQTRVLPGILLMLAFCVLAPLLDTCSKLATATIPVGQITAARFLVQGLLMAPIAVAMGLRLRLSLPRRLWWLMTLRTLFLIANPKAHTVCADRVDSAGHFKAGNIGRSLGWWRILALPLQQVRPIDTRRRNLNQHCVCGWNRSRPLDTLQNLGRPECRNADCLHCLLSPAFIIQ